MVPNAIPVASRAVAATSSTASRRTITLVRSSHDPSGPVADITSAAVPVVPSEKPTIRAVTEASVLIPWVSAAVPRVMHQAMITTGTTDDRAATIAQRRT